MEKIAFLFSPDPENIFSILQKVLYDLSFLVILYEWITGRIKLAIENLFVDHHYWSNEQLSKILVNAVHILVQKEKRNVAQRHLQQRMISAVDNFF
ncbi:MAG: hypothetical protein K9H64_10315 [Bacteroidales bacterium]|nr:hypothetical protein [Bacteroidales bacterium]MCF8456262.1 hypothetical protein [Bacteroidales bacterium]